MPQPRPAELADPPERLFSRFWWLMLGGFAAAIFGLVFFFLQQTPAVSSEPVKGSVYVTDMRQMEQEFARAAGKPFDDEAARREMERAQLAAGRGEYQRALALLEAVLMRVPIPALYNNVGVLHAKLEDFPRARDSFHKAMSLESGYSPARTNLSQLTVLGLGADQPVNQEAEPNNIAINANLIALDQAVTGQITDRTDTDYFRFAVPEEVRDVFEISIDNQSKTLAPGLRLFNAERRFVGWGQGTREGGATVQQFLSPDPGASFHLQVYGHAGTSGKYSLTVRPLKAFDQFEPNDDILHSRDLPLNKTIAAGIMDARDTDFFEVSSPRTGPITVQIENRSKTLRPALSVYSPDRRIIEFGPEVMQAGGNLTHTFKAEGYARYYLQVWSQGETSGSYQLTVR